MDKLQILLVTEDKESKDISLTVARNTRIGDIKNFT